MLLEKCCKNCQIIKPITEYSLASSNRGGYSHTCKRCKADHSSNYYKTLAGVISGIYNCQLQSSRTRLHPAPTYTKQELTTWLHNQNVEIIFSDWVDSNYNTFLRPSVDRIDSTQPYSFDNIRLVTWKENSDAAYEERKTCKRVTKQNKKIEQLTTDGKHVAIYLSQAHAARDTGFCRTNINHTCQGYREAAHGFLWRYA